MSYVSVDWSFFFSSQMYTLEILLTQMEVITNAAGKILMKMKSGL